MKRSCNANPRSASAIPELEQKVLKAAKERDSIAIPNEEAVEEYCLIKKQLTDLSAEIRSVINKPETCIPFLQVSL